MSWARSYNVTSKDRTERSHLRRTQHKVEMEGTKIHSSKTTEAKATLRTTTWEAVAVVVLLQDKILTWDLEEDLVDLAAKVAQEVPAT